MNLTAAFRLTRGVLGQMMRERFGRIVNVSSVVGLRANPGQANYAAAKAGLIALTRTVAAEVGRRGITVNAVAPGLIETELTREITSNGADGLLGEIPARRSGSPEEVAACIRFLVSDEASYVNGRSCRSTAGWPPESINERRDRTTAIKDQVTERVISRWSSSARNRRTSSRTRASRSSTSTRSTWSSSPR